MDARLVAEAIKVKAVRNAIPEGELPVVEREPAPCSRCGGEGFFDYPTFRQYVNGACFRCGGTTVDPTHKRPVLRGDVTPNAATDIEAWAAAREAKRDAKAAAVRAAAAAAEVAKDTALAKLAETSRGLAYVLANADAAPEFARSIVATVREHGAITEKQAAALDRVADEATAPKVEIAEGRYEIVGAVVGSRSRHGQWGLETRIIVKLDAGGLVMGSWPRGLPARACEGDEPTGEGCLDGHTLKGLRVRMVATVVRSDRDVSFGFFKRPVVKP